MTCILTDYRRDQCASCSELCPHRISFHGLHGDGGRTASANIPKDYRHNTLKTSPAREGQAKIYATLEKYAATFKRHLSGGERAKSLYLWSESPGTGKTTTAAALLNAWLASEYLHAIKRKEPPQQANAYFLDVTELQTQYNLATMTKDDEGIERIGAIINRVQSANFAVLDDVGTRSSTEAFTAYIHAIVNHRTANGLPTIFTSNLPLKSSVPVDKRVAIEKPYDIEDIFGARIYDRMRDQCLAIYFEGESKRGRR